MLGVFKAIFLNLFLLLGMVGLALAADSNHAVCVDHDVRISSAGDGYNIRGHEDIAQMHQDIWGARWDGAVDMASLLKQIASDPAMRRALYCLMKNELGARYGGANGSINAADDIMIGSIGALLTAGASKFGGSAKFAAKLRGMANKIGKSRVGGVVDVAPGTGAFKNWNQFQAGTKGQFASRAEAGKAWSAYKDANGIVTGATRSSAARSQFLKGMGESGNSPKWMNQWLQQGKVPPGYHVDHIKPLSIG